MIEAGFVLHKAFEQCEAELIVDRGGSVRLNSSGRFVKWISASIMLRPGLASAL